LADALDSKSSDRKIVWVRAPPPASRVPSILTVVTSKFMPCGRLSLDAPLTTRHAIALHHLQDWGNILS